MATSAPSAALAPLSTALPCMHCTAGYWAPDPQCPVCWGTGEVCAMCEERAPEERGKAFCRECRQSLGLEENVAGVKEAA